MREKKALKYAIFSILCLWSFLLLMIALWDPWIVSIIKALQDPTRFAKWLTSFGLFARFVMVLCVMMKVIFPILPGKVLEIVAGYCFGFVDALILLLIANAVGTWIVHMLVKRFGIRMVTHIISQKMLDEFPLWKEEQRFTFLLWMTYLIPGTPKDALTYVISLSNMKTGKLVLITTVARSFTVAVGVLSGTALYEQKIITFLWITLGFVIISLLGAYCFRSYIHKHRKT